MRPPKRDNAVWLSAYGWAPAVPAHALQAGNITIWEFGATSEVLAVTVMSRNYVAVTERTRASAGRVSKTTRKIAKTRLIGLSPDSAHRANNPQLADLPAI